MTLQFTIDFRAVLAGFVLVLVAAAVAAPFAISLADDGALPAGPTAAIGTGFSYQGRLEVNGIPASGVYDFQVLLREDPDGLNSVPGTTPNTLPDVQVTNGVFTVNLDFLVAVAFNGQERWLDIRVRPGAESGTYTPLAPLHRLAPVPYAVYASTAPWAGISGVPADLLNGDQDTLYTALPGGGLTLTGTAFEADTTFLQRRVGTSCAAGSSIRVINDDGSVGCETDDTSVSNPGWNISGNAGTVVGTNFLGTTDNKPLELRVNNQRALRIVPGTTPNVIGGHAANEAGAGVNESIPVVGATIGGGGGVSGSCLVINRVRDDFGTVGGGCGNYAGSVGTGTARYATITGGFQNRANGSSSTVGGGDNNAARQTSSTVGGGFGNDANGIASTVGGGSVNQAPGAAATVGGGDSNQASGYGATVGGGASNTIIGDYGTVPGGVSNIAGNYSFAAGRNAGANATGSFVWADSTGFPFINNTAPNAFSVRASGGFYIATNAAGNVGVQIAPGANSWSPISDRNAKANFLTVDTRELLSRLAAMPMETWNYNTQDESIRHIGPMAQDFFAAFGVGEDNLHISTIDADGVALAAIQGLNARADEHEARIAAIESSSVRPESADPRVDALAAEVAAIARRPIQAGSGATWLTYALIAVAFLGAGFGIGQMRRNRDGVSPAT